MKYFILSIILFLCHVNSFGQTYVTGGQEEDDSVYLQASEADFYDNTKADRFDIRTDLTARLNLPVQQQGRFKTCTSMAVATALTINHIQQTEQKNLTFAEMPAAWYLHRSTNQANDRSCQNGLPISLVLKQLQKRGTVTNNSDISLGVCQTESFKSPQLPYQIQQFQRLFQPDTTKQFKRYQIKKSLSKGYPVIFNIGVEERFQLLNANNDLYLPPPNPAAKFTTHTMLIVGHSEAKKAFKVMNSWGKNWGNKGYCWIPYHLIEAKCRNAYIIKSTTRTVVSNPCSIPQNKLSGDFQIRTVSGEIHLQDDIYQPTFRIKQVSRQDNIYRTTQPLALGEAFQVRAEQLDHYLYAFSYDPSRNLQTHFPVERGDVCPGSNGFEDYRTFLPNKYEEITVPYYDNAALTEVNGEPVVTHPQLLEKTKTGTEYFVLLYSLQQIPDDTLADLLCQLEAQTTTKNFVPDLQQIFKKYLMSPTEINYSSDGLNFRAASCTGVMVPVIIKIE